MKDIFSFIKSKYKSIFNGLLFLVALLIIVNLLPREGKFKYEFQKGKPWMHETLIAPYDFPVYKSQRQIKEERDSVLNHFKPYFRYDTLVLKQQLRRFTEAYNRQLREEFNDKYNDRELKEVFAGSRFEQITQQFYDRINKVMKRIYHQGVIEAAEINGTLDKNSQIVVVRNNVAEDYQFSDIHDQKEAYKRLINRMEGHIDSLELENERQRNFFSTLNYYDYIKPNVFYDQETSQKVKQNLLENISITKGMVQAGERIVSKGEVVDGQTYQIIESLRREYEKNLGSDYKYNLIYLGQVIFVFGAIFVLYLFLFHFR